MIRILVVEDDRDISALIQLALKNAGYDVLPLLMGRRVQICWKRKNLSFACWTLCCRRSADTNYFHILMSIQYR